MEAERKEVVRMSEEVTSGEVAHCPWCGERVYRDGTDDATVYHEVVSWVTGPKLDGPVLRERTGRIAHPECIDKIRNGQAPDQEPLF